MFILKICLQEQDCHYSSVVQFSLNYRFLKNYFKIQKLQSIYLLTILSFTTLSHKINTICTFTSFVYLKCCTFIKNLKYIEDYSVKLH